MRTTNEGRITVDRYLDAVTQHTRRPSPRKPSTRPPTTKSIVALEEAKGTLLEHDQITVVDGPKSAVSIADSSRLRGQRRMV